MVALVHDTMSICFWAGVSGLNDTFVLDLACWAVDFCCWGGFGWAAAGFCCCCCTVSTGRNSCTCALYDLEGIFI
eukprot:COSAG05_NODE_1124_length_5792_cov_13.204286_1_plen_75_part_00